MSEKKAKVLLIVGNTRSGSTLLDRLLGQLPGCFSVGEFYWVWHHCFLKNQACACGAPFNECAFWQQVVEDAFGGFAQVDAERLVALQRAVEGRRYTVPRDTGSDEAREYTTHLSNLYRAIHKAAKCELIVDSSKFPSRGFLLQGMADVDLYIVHIVRDSRAVAYSWQRKKVRPEIHWKQVLMARKSPLHCALTWNASNALAHLLRRRADPQRYMLVRYEDLAGDPRRELTKLATWLGRQEAVYLPHGDGEGALKFLDGTQADLGGNHTVAGNPMRFERGQIEIRADTEWQKSMSRKDQAVVSALTWPLLHKYGYL